jgi:hypothetical protein
MCLIDPIGINVTDFEQGKEFRKAVPRPLVYHFVTDINNGAEFGVDAKTVSMAYGAASSVDV